MGTAAQKNQKYWKGRQAQLLKSLERDEAVMSKSIKKYLQQEYADLDKTIASYYAKYGKDNVIEYRNLLKDLDKADKDLLMKQMDDFAKKYPQYTHLMPVRESIYKLNRLEGLQYSIKMQQLNIGAIEQAEYKRHLGKYAKLGYEGIAGFNSMNIALMNSIVDVIWTAGGKYSQRIWKNKTAISDFLQKEFTRGVIRGDNYQTMSRLLRQRFVDASAKEAMRLIYTEGSFVLNESQMRAFEEMGYTHYKYETAQDGKVCDICSALQGEVFEVKTRSPGKNFPPMHPWCRCVFAIELIKSDEIYLGSGYGNVGVGETIPIGHVSPDDLDSQMREWENELRKLKYEGAYSVDAKGNAYFTKGDKTSVYPSGFDYKGSTILHNHITTKYGVGQSFSEDDYVFLQKHPEIKELRLITDEYRYSLSALKKLDLSSNEVYRRGLKTEGDQYHNMMEWLKNAGYTKYIRKKI